jgi:tRNA threonylcarbamoyl adenosine modification protein (Sua5/YciO/YrdC/YwlC family)
MPPPPVVIDVRTADDVRDVVHRAVQALAEGHLVALPTETVYGLAASARDAAAVDRLIQAKGRVSGHPLALAIKSEYDALDFVPDMPPLARRLARRCWPGPVTLVLDAEHPESLLGQLPESVRQAVCPHGTLGLRVPAHNLIIEVLRLSAGPLVLTSANRTGGAEPTTADEVTAQLSDHLSLVLDDGPSRYGQPSSVVRVGPGQLEILRSGVVSESSLRQLASFMVLVVCTGNTCRSPMAEVLLRSRIADQLGCGPEEVDGRGVVVASAGIAAMTGGRPTTEAVDVMAERGLDLSGHVSQPVTERLVRQADLILAMTRSHREAIAVQWPAAASRTRVLCRNGTDVADPIGGSRELYARCADQIDEQLREHVSDWDLDLPFPVGHEDMEGI